MEAPMWLSLSSVFPLVVWRTLSDDHGCYRSSLYFTIPILNAIIRAFSLYGNPPHLHSLYFVAYTHVCILLLPEP